MKKFSLILIVLSSAGIVVGQVIDLVGNDLWGTKMLGISFISLGFASILLGIHILKRGIKKSDA